MAALTKKEEGDRVFEFTKRIPTLSGEDRYKAIGDMFDFIASSQHLLDSTVFRKHILQKVSEIANAGIVQLNTPLRRLCDALRRYEPTADISGCAPPTAANISAAAAAAFLREASEASRLYSQVEAAAVGNTAPLVAFLEYILKTKEYLKNPETRTRVKSAIAAAAATRDYVFRRTGLLAKVCAKVEAMEPVGSSPIPGCPAPASVLGKGTYGAVFRPALSNIDIATGVLREFPDNVTKVFYREKNATDAINTAKNIANLMGHNEGHRVFPYTKSYMLGNLPESAAEVLREHNVDYETPLHLMRAPYLGTDVYRIEDVYKELRKVPVHTILQQMTKLVQQVGRLYEKKYSHMDIRPSNVIVNPKTGALTIIDFDWLLPYEKVYQKYPFGFYSNPPECLIPEDQFVDLLGEEKDPTLDDLYPTDDTVETYDKYSKTTLKEFGSVLYNGDEQMDMHDLQKAILEGHVETIKYLRAAIEKKKYTHYHELYINEIIPYIDGYGLGMTMRVVLRWYCPGLYPKSDDSLISSKYGYSQKDIDAMRSMNALFMRMSSFNRAERPVPTDAAKEASEILATYEAAAGAAGAAGAAAELPLLPNSPASVHKSSVLYTSPAGRRAKTHRRKRMQRRRKTRRT